MHERVLVQHDRQNQCCRKQGGVDGIAQVAKRGSHGPTSAKICCEATNEEQPATRDYRNDVDEFDVRIEGDHCHALMWAEASA